jgi:hypothetical protein
VTASGGQRMASGMGETIDLHSPLAIRCSPN